MFFWQEYLRFAPVDCNLSSTMDCSKPQTSFKSDWLGLSVVAILEGALAPTLIFAALSLTMVNNVILVGTN
jgi:hypothetical protein